LLEGEVELLERLEKLLSELLEKQGSDLHLKVGRPPLMRISGDLIPSDGPALTEDEVKEMVFGLLGEERARRFQKEREVDFSYLLPGKSRFRVNAFFQMEKIGAVFRSIPIHPPTIDELGLPPVLKEIALRKQGLVLFTGPTGVGKTTSMAAVIEHINTNRPCHVMTLEDPVEFVFTDKLATINQRQLGSDTLSLEQALKHVLRQDPDVILMGEMRDIDTMETAMHAAETGHLVLSTIHTNNCTQTMDRILDMFHGAKMHQLRSMLAQTLLAILSQRLVRRADGAGRVAAVEILINTPNIKQLIEEGNVNQIEKAMRIGGYYQMQTFNQHLAKMVMDGVITAEEALANSSSPTDLRLLLRGVATGTESIDQAEKERLSTEGTAPETQKRKPSISKGFYGT